MLSRALLLNVKKCSFHLTVKCSKNRGHLQSVGRHESSCHWVLYYPLSFSSFAEHSLHAYTLPSPQWAHVDCQKKGSRLVGQRRQLQKPSMGTHEQGWVANHTQYIFSPEMSNYDNACTGHGSLATRSQVINTAGLCNDYAFLSGLQAQEIRLGSPDRFPRERCGLGTRLITLPPTTWLLHLPSLYYPLQYMYVLPPLTLHISCALLQLYVTTHHPGWETITLLQLNGQHLSRIQETDLGTHSCHYSHTHTHAHHTHTTHTHTPHTHTHTHTLNSHTHTYTHTH